MSATGRFTANRGAISMRNTQPTGRCIFRMHLQKKEKGAIAMKLALPARREIRTSWPHQG